MGLLRVPTAVWFASPITLGAPRRRQFATNTPAQVRNPLQLCWPVSYSAVCEYTRHVCGVTRWLRGPSALFLALCLLWRWRVSGEACARAVTHGHVLLL